MPNNRWVDRQTEKNRFMSSATLPRLLVEGIGPFSCTTFCIKKKGAIVYGRNFDFVIGHGHVVINKRNVTKTSLVPPSEKQLEWTSRYGSISFNQLGREFPYGGMNEAGLVIEQLWLDCTQYPGEDERYALSVLQWIQYQLDTAGCVDDVIASNGIVRISNASGANLHFFVADKQGGVATIEFLEGKLVFHSGNSLSHPVLTNNTYHDSLSYLSGHPDFLHAESNGFTGGSLDRFRRASDMVAEASDSEDLEAFAFNILDAVSQAAFTQWSIVYNLSEMTICLKTPGNHPKKEFKFKEFNFSSQCSSQYMDITSEHEFELSPCSFEANLELVKSVFENLEMLKGMPEEVVQLTARYPETTVFNDSSS